MLIKTKVYHAGDSLANKKMHLRAHGAEDHSGSLSHCLQGAMRHWLEKKKKIFTGDSSVVCNNIKKLTE